MVQIEEVLGDDCRYVVDCCTILYESSAYHFVNTVDRTGHPGRHRTGHNRRLLYIGDRGIGHGGRPISFGCRCGSGRRLDGSHHHGAAHLVIVVARYPDSGRIAARPNVSMYSEARTGEPEPSLCG